MNRKAIIVHGWDSDPEDAWLPWLKRELLRRGYEVIIPAMPQPETPTIHSWVKYLEKVAGPIDSGTVLVGHSIGCQAILRYVEQLPADTKIAKIILVAPWLTLHNLETDEEKEVAREWLETPMVFPRITSHVAVIDVLLSDNDPWVPLEENKRLLQANLHAVVVVKHAMSHFEGSAGITELPDLLPLIESDGDKLRQ